jgi:hypothetical protein
VKQSTPEEAVSAPYIGVMPPNLKQGVRNTFNNGTLTSTLSINNKKAEEKKS